VQAAWDAGYRNVLMRSATGSGKTVTLGSIVNAEAGASCVIAHRQELVGQLSLTLARYGVRHDLIASDTTKRTIAALHVAELGGCCFVTPGARCVVASVDTLVRRAAKVAPWAAHVKLWVVDECNHLVLDNKWHKAVQLFTHPEVRGLGPTATPLRADGKGLGAEHLGGDGVFHAMVEGPPERWLIEQGFLADYRVICRESDLRLLETDVGASGDWSMAQLRDASRRSHIVGDVVAHYQKHAAGLLTMTFCTDVETATTTTQAFRAAGIPAETLTGETDDRLRQQMLHRFARREILQLVSVDVVSEGFDLPALECVQMARPTQSLSLYRQQFGRALRPKADGGKALVIDHVGNFLRHGPPDRPIVWTLARRDKRARSVNDAIPLRVCVECFQPYERIYAACPYCGHVPIPAGRGSPAQVDGDLSELDPSVLALLRGQMLAALAPIEEERARLTATGLPHLLVRANINRHAEKLDAQVRLGEAIAAWGTARLTDGYDHRQRQKLFFLRFGVDVLSARALGRAEAETLRERIAAQQ
jgi:superfamily II DNA or RNA helicase